MLTKWQMNSRRLAELPISIGRSLRDTPFVPNTRKRFMTRFTSLQTQFLSPQDAAHIVHRKGLAACLSGMAAYIRADFLRWNAFDKCARVASHSPDGVIELMPIA